MGDSTRAARRRVAANGTTLHITVRGPERAPALVLLHYFAGSGRAWDAVVDTLGDGARCVAPDLRGHGDSDGPPGGYTVADGADDVAALVAALGLAADGAGYTLVGHSMGGKIALALAARRPPGLRSVVLLAPSPPTPEPMDEAARTRLLASHGDRAAARATVARVTVRPLPAAAHARAVADNLRTAPAAWRAWLERGSREDIAAATSEIAVPVLAVAGGADPVIPEAVVVHEVVERVPGARLALMPGVGHLQPLEAPTAVAELLASALRVDDR